MSDPARFLPIVYDPTVGEACLKFGHIFRRPRGMYLSLDHRKGRVKEVLRNWPEKDVRVICVTDGERILGLGDLGANGMGIPIGKLQLYTACAGVPPQCLLPMYLDSGTNNQTLLNDPLYLGLRQPRVSTAELDAFVDEFVEAVQEVFPSCCIHFEDWAGRRRDAAAGPLPRQGVLLQRRHPGHGRRGPGRDPDALRVTGGKLRDQRILFLGAGSAGIGIADLIASAMTLEGLSARRGRGPHLAVRCQRPARAEPHRPVRLPEAVRPSARALERFRRRHRVPQADRHHRRQHHGQDFHPEGRRGDVPHQRAADHLRPLEPHRARGMHPRGGLSLVRGTGAVCGGRAVPAGAVSDGKTLPGQGNNLYIFPAVGLAIYATKSTAVTDEMFIAAARAVADQVTQAELDGLLYPPQSHILEDRGRGRGQGSRNPSSPGVWPASRSRGTCGGSSRSTLQARVHEPLVKT